ncbi:MAG: hypothetical protein Q8N55_02890, partial [bacterium]|nr:hypothetical protein [bacterium]
RIKRESFKRANLYTIMWGLKKFRIFFKIYMQWLPFKITEQEKQALKKSGRGGKFKLFQKEIIAYIILLILAVALLWRHYVALTFVITTLAGTITVRYCTLLRANKATLSVANKVESKLNKQQENALKFKPKVLLFVVLPLMLLLVGVVVYVLYLPVYKERKEMIYGFNPRIQAPIVGEDANQLTDETADWQTYRSEEYGYTIKYPAGWEAKDKDASYWCQENSERDCQLYIQFFPPSTQNYSWVSLVIYGNAWRGEGEEKQTNGCQKISNFFLYKDSLFDLTTCFGLGQGSTEEIYRQMLSTFKFIN